MDFSLTTLFVVPPSNTLPTSGSTQDLTAGQVGTYLPNYAVATAGNIAAAKYFYIAQGRVERYSMASKRSDKIHASNIVDWYKVNGEPDVLNEIWDVSDFTVKCGESVTLTIRAHSSYIDAGFFNGLTRSITVQAPCCDCGADPCVEVDECALIDDFIEKLEATVVPSGIKDGTRLTLTTFFTFQKLETEGACSLRIVGKSLDVYGNACDVAAFPWEYDRLWFRVFVTKGTDTTQDFIVYDNCNTAATTTLVQRSTYVAGSSAEIAQLEKDYHSYQSIHKHLFRLSGYNQTFESNVVDGLTYDMYVIKAREHDQQNTWGDFVPLDFTVLLAIPQGDGAADDLIPVIEAALGAAKDNSCLDTPTTTSTTTTTSSTTTTTQPIP